MLTVLLLPTNLRSAGHQCRQNSPRPRPRAPPQAMRRTPYRRDDAGYQIVPYLTLPKLNCEGDVLMVDFSLNSARNFGKMLRPNQRAEE